MSTISIPTPFRRQFPSDIIQLIVEASLNPYDLFAQYPYQPKLRYATLKLFSLLNSTWCGASRAELVKWVEICTEGSAIRFLELVQQRGGTLGGVKDMFVNSMFVTDPSTLAKLLRCAPQVINLRVLGGSVDIYDLAQLQQLRRVELAICSIVRTPSSSLLCLPQLQRLDIKKCRVEDSALHFLTPAFLPQLRRVNTDDLDIVSPLIQQLEIINARPFRWDFALLARATSLLLLPLPHSADERLEMLAKLPSLPPFLHAAIPPYEVGNYSDAQKEIVEALEDLLETKKSGLRVILVNDYEIDDSIESLIRRFQERGIRVQLVDEESDFSDAIDEMEKIRAKEKRASEGAGTRRG